MTSPIRALPASHPGTALSLAGGSSLSYAPLSWLVAAIAVVSVVTVLVAASIVPLSNTTYVSAMVTLQGDRKSIQHAEGGIVSAVLVANGQEVQAGQELVTLDGGRIRSASLDARAQYCDLRLETARLVEVANLSPASLVDASDATNCDFAGLSELDKHASATKVAAHAAHVRSLDMVQTSLRAELGAMEQHRSLSAVQSTLDQSDLAIRAELERSGYGSKVSRIAAQRQLLVSQGIGLDLDLRIKELQNRLAQSVADMTDYQRSYESAVLAELDKVTRSLSEAQARMRVLHDQEAHLSIRSPVRGYILGLSVHSVGSVISAGSVIMEIVPVGPAMMIEGKVRPIDSPTLAAGQLVQARVMRANGRPLTLRAHLVDLSSDRLMDRADNPFFVFHAQFDINQNIPAGLIRAGLPVDLIITTGQQTPLEALIGPTLFWLQGRT